MNEEYICVTYGFMGFIDSHQFFSSSLDSLVKSLDSDDFVILEKQFPYKWQ